jgi:hypothetical protein
VSDPTSEPYVEATDPDGTTVVLRAGTWTHIVRRHPELEGSGEEIQRALTSPTHRRPGREPDETWFYLALQPESLAPWLKVVVRYGEGSGQVVTAFLRRSMP